MKTMMISKPPKIVANVLNGLASILMFKTCPKDWKDYLSGKTKEMPKPIDVYIYCTKGKYEMGKFNSDKKYHEIRDDCCYAGGWLRGLPDEIVNGKVVAKFTLNKVIKYPYISDKYDELIGSCLSEKELLDYSTINFENGIRFVKTLYAWHISNLVIFDRPKELEEFMAVSKKTLPPKNKYILTKAPQSWCYVEVE